MARHHANVMRPIAATVPTCSGPSPSARLSTRLLKLKPYLLTQSLHQPRALTGPSTSLQEDGGMNSLQFAQL
jgi:hypothetical protein